MPIELYSVIIGGMIGISGGLLTTIFVKWLENKRRKKSIIAVEAGEIVAIKEKAERFIGDLSTHKELKASTPMLLSLASEIGYLSAEQVIAIRRAVTLDMEMREGGNKNKAFECVTACNEALRLMRIDN